MRKSKSKPLTLTEKEKAFCECYSNYGCSGVAAIYDAGYKQKNKETAYSMASENLRKPKILAYIKHLYSEHSFTDEDITREHLYLIRQHHDLSAKARGIDMYYKKNGYYSAGSMEKNSTTTVVVTQYSEMSDEQLEERYQALKRKILE